MKLYSIHTGPEVYETQGDEHSIYDDKIVIFRDKESVMIIDINKIEVIEIETIKNL
jgi:hypothetical protein